MTMSSAPRLDAWVTGLNYLAARCSKACVSANFSVKLLLARALSAIALMPLPLRSAVADALRHLDKTMGNATEVFCHARRFGHRVTPHL